MSNESLELVRRELAEHFAHEEALFEEHGFGAHKDERFSAKKSHIADHKRILDKVSEQLRSCHGLTRIFVQDLLQDFHDHTGKYDVQYSELMSSRGVK